jgi:hypothetical protein
MSGIVLRMGAYTLTVLGVLLVLPRLTEATNRTLFQEGGAVESTQLGVLLFAALTLALAAVRWRPLRQLYIALALLPLVAAVRELDCWLQHIIPVLGWKLPAGAIVAVLLVHGLRHLHLIISQASLFIPTLSMGMLWAGFIVVVFIAQLVGDWRYLNAVMGDAYHRDYKRAIEETLELMGYLVMCLGAIECWCHCPEGALASSPDAAATEATHERATYPQAVS